MSLYTTPLQFAYFLALLFAVLLWYRGWHVERLSDTLLGWVMFLLAMEIQDYTFGFSGINFLWEEMNGFPRYFALAFAPTIYFYLRAQVNRDFKFGKRQMLHYVPFALYFLTGLFIFLQGQHVVEKWQRSEWFIWSSRFEIIAIWVSYVYYFYHSLKMYQSYREWANHQLSDTELVNFKWIRNFIYLIIAGEVFKWVWFIADFWLDLDFEEDWWWHLLTVVIICYVGIRGYTQIQPRYLHFRSEEDSQPATKGPVQVSLEDPGNIDTVWKTKIDRLMSEQKIYLQAELTLPEMAVKLKTNASLLSSAINQIYRKNFNDFINEYRVEEFKIQASSPENKHLTLLAIAYECGFNSKATFNRAVKKFTGLSPREMM